MRRHRVHTSLWRTRWTRFAIQHKSFAVLLSVPLRVVITLALGALFCVAEDSSSRLRYTLPEDWQRKSDAKEQVASFAAPGREASVTFTPSLKFDGTSKQWQHKLWGQLVKASNLTKPPVLGVHGQFLTSVGTMSRYDGSKYLICLFSLVKNGRGEGVVFFASDQRQFDTHLPAVNRMVDNIIISGEIPRMQWNKTNTNTGLLPAAARPAPETPTTPKPAALRLNPTSGRSGHLAPLLTHDEPANFLRSGGKSPIEYASREVNASIQVYAFRPYSGEIRILFQQTLLRDWIDPRYREGRLNGQPEISTNSIPGADAVLVARYRENNVGIAKPRLRILILAGNNAAIIDARANDATCWQHIGASLEAMLASVRVEKKAAPPSVDGAPGPAGTAFAGLYMGIKPKYTVNLFGRVGSGYYVDAVHYYLFSADGDVYRRYDFPPEPNGDWRQFDFSTARQEDPGNTGRFTINGNGLVIQLGGPSSQMITVPLSDSSLLQIGTVTYERKQ